MPVTLRPLALVLLALAAAGCEDAVDPTLGLDAPFSLYGYLDPTADRQAVRVVPIVGSLDADSLTLDAAVTSTDLETGQTTTWRDSLVTFDDGSVGHVFVAPITPRPGSTVRLEARRSDGAASSVEVAVPPIVPAEVGPAVAVPGEVTYPVRFAGAPRVLNGQLRLVVRGLPSAPDEPRVVTVPVSVAPAELSAGVWGLDVPFLSAARAYLADEGLLGAGVRLVAADYVGFVTNEAWNPPSDDPDALIEPGTFENVEGGLGFVGAGYFATARWVPSPAAQTSAGFLVDRDPVSYVAINEIQTGPGGWVEFYNPLFSDIDLAGYSISNTGLTPRLQTFPFGVVVPARGFLVINFTFTLDNEGALGLYDRASTLVSRVVTGRLADGLPGGVTWGAYPDGLSFKVPPALGGFDVFYGALRPTPMQPNELGLDVAAVNEVYTEGAAGWAEVAATGGGSGLALMTDPEGYFEAVAASRPPGAAFWVADEDGAGLDLPQVGGTVYLVATFNDPRILAPPRDESGARRIDNRRVVDVRTYGGQTAGRSSGYLPDAPGGTWTPDLRPTRGAPNAAARLGL